MSNYDDSGLLVNIILQCFFSSFDITTKLIFLVLFFFQLFAMRGSVTHHMNECQYMHAEINDPFCMALKQLGIKLKVFLSSFFLIL